MDMILNKTETEIMALILKMPLESFTSYQIAKKTNRYISQIQKAIERLNKIGLLQSKKAGVKAKIWKIDFSHSDIDMLCLSSIFLKKRFLEKNLKIKAILSQIDEKLHESSEILILFGSYAKESSTDKSDIDLCILVQNDKEIDDVKKKFESALERFSYNIHLNIFTIHNFYEMLKEKHTVGREIFKSCIVLRGFDAYYRMVKRYDKEYGY
jgi:predicted nucleotidyltransferase